MDGTRLVELTEENANLRHKLNWYRTKLHELREEVLTLKEVIEEIKQCPEAAEIILTANHVG